MFTHIWSFPFGHVTHGDHVIKILNPAGQDLV